MQNITLDSKSHKDFLLWLRKRLENKYKEKDQSVLKRLNEIIYAHRLIPGSLPPDTIDAICVKYFERFVPKKDQDVLREAFGQELVDQQNNNIRQFVISMFEELLNIPQSTTKSMVHNNKQNNDNQNHNIDFSLFE